MHACVCICIYICVCAFMRVCMFWKVLQELVKPYAISLNTLNLNSHFIYQL